MDFLEWKQDFSVGLPQMDNEHKMMFSLINDLNGRIHSGEGHVSLSYIFTSMKAYSSYHFSSEEELLATVNYPELSTQQQSHEGFIKRISEFEEDMLNREVDIAPKVMNFLKVWWVGHIQNEDKKYAEYVKNK